LPRPVGSHADPASRVALPRIWSRRHRRSLDRQSIRVGQRSCENRKLFPTASAHSQSIDRASFHYPAFPGWDKLRQSVLDPPANREKNRALDGKTAGVLSKHVGTTPSSARSSEARQLLTSRKSR